MFASPANDSCLRLLCVQSDRLDPLPSSLMAGRQLLWLASLLVAVQRLRWAVQGKSKAIQSHCVSTFLTSPLVMKSFKMAGVNNSGGRGQTTNAPRTVHLLGERRAKSFSISHFIFLIFHLKPGARPKGTILVCDDK